MINFHRIVGFEWDVGNAYKSQDKHGISQVQAEEIFFNQPLLIDEDAKHSDVERRFLALGITVAGVLLAVIFTLRKKESLIRVVSARPMSKKERAFYEKA
jgi:uncharacterized DUF497 family protein